MTTFTDPEIHLTGVGNISVPKAVSCFELRCWARSYLVQYGMMSLNDAVDALQESAVSTGVVDFLGQDAVQLIMAKEFPIAEGTALVTRHANEGPWPTDLTHGGMSEKSAELSYRADKKGRLEDSAKQIAPRSSARESEPPFPESLADYGPSVDASFEAIQQSVAAPAQRNLTFKKFADISLSTAARYLVKGLIPNAGLVVIWGAPKCGKSFFVFDLVAHIAAGWEYRARRVKQGPVVYFALEGQEGFIARVEAFRRVHGAEDFPFYLSADRIVLPQDSAAVVQSIKAQFPDVKPDVVVLDTLNRSLSGSENDPNDMGRYVRAADAIREAFDCVVIIIHHCGVEGSRPRGHTSLTGAADAQIAVRRDAADKIIALVEFMKDGPEGDEIVSTLEQVTVGTDDDGDAITSCIIRAADVAAGTKGKERITGPAAIAFKLLQGLIIEAGEVPPANSHIPPNTRTIAEKTWRAKCYAGMSQDDTTQTARQKAFVRASNKLQERHLIGKCGDLVWIA